MCTSPRVPAPDTRLQEQSMELQRQQMEVSKRQMALQNAMALENQRISAAPPPPLPNETAQVAALPLDTASRAIAVGSGRRRMRTSRSYSNLSIA